MLEMQRKYDIMSNMKDYMMWLDDKGIATWDNVLGELIVPDEVDIYEDTLLDRYKNDAVWNGLDVPGIDTDEDDYVIDDDDDDRDYELDDDELGDIQLKVDTIGSLLDTVFSDDPVAKRFTDLIDTDMLTRLWDISEDIRRLNEEDKHGWSEDQYWFNDDGGLTGDAQNYLHELDAKGELI
jgi:hypothetical protein